MDKLLGLQAINQLQRVEPSKSGFEHRDALERKIERDTIWAAVIVGATVGFLIGLSAELLMHQLYELTRGLL